MLQRVISFVFLTTNHYDTSNILYRRSSVLSLFNTTEISLHAATWTVA